MEKAGKLLRRYREEAGISSTDMVEVFGKTKQWLSLVEHGKIRLRGNVLAQYLGKVGKTVAEYERTLGLSSDIRPAEHVGIPLVNKAPAGPAWDYEEHGVSSRDGTAYMAREEGENSEDLFAVEVVGESMLPELKPRDRVVLYPVPPGIPPATIDGQIVFARFREDEGGGCCLAQIKFLNKHDDEKGHRVKLVKLNKQFTSREVWLTDLERLAVAVRSVRPLWRM